MLKRPARPLFTPMSLVLATEALKRQVPGALFSMDSFALNISSEFEFFLHRDYAALLCLHKVRAAFQYVGMKEVSNAFQIQ